jgi:sugar/nucleoside kinase (ribokinase family)
MNQPLEVVTMGHAIVDVLAFSDDELVASHGLGKGTMTLVEGDRAEEIYASLGSTTEVSGGSAANTAAGLASLGAAVAFLGKVRDDSLGRVFIHDIRAAGVRFDVPPASEGPGTGRSMIMVSPDAEKTMCTSLGMGACLLPEDLDEAAIAGAEILYLEGYMYGDRPTNPAVERAIDLAKQSGTLVALSLSDPYWVDLHRDELDKLIDPVDVLFANEQEAIGMTCVDDVAQATKRLSARCEHLVVTLGPKGSLVVVNDELVSVPAVEVEQVTDTTGAGDSFAAGFLFGMVRGYGPERCSQLGALAAAEVVSHLGARPQQPLSEMAAAAGLL